MVWPLYGYYTVMPGLPHQLLRHIGYACATPMAVAAPNSREMHGGHVLQPDNCV
jgi:hypothetical protein